MYYTQPLGIRILGGVLYLTPLGVLRVFRSFIHWTQYAFSTPIQHMRVHHRGLHVFMSE